MATLCGRRLVVSTPSKSRRLLAKSTLTFLAEPLETRRLLSDVSLVYAAKTIDYMQTASGAPTLASSNAYDFGAGVQETAANTVSSAKGTGPNGQSQAMTLDSTQNKFKIEADFNSQADLDANCPDGTYTMQINAVNDGTHTVTGNLTGDQYPSPGQFTNYNALQNVNPATATTITWTPMGGGSNEYVKLGIDDATTGDTVFQTPDPDTSGALTGTSSSVTVPVGTFVAGHQYDAWLDFINIVSSDTTDYPGVPAVGGYGAETDLNFTAGAGSASIAGNIYSDTNASGVYNPADPGINDVMVYLDANNNGNLDAGEISVNTNASGNYLFRNLAAGTYTVREVVPGNYVQTSPGSGALSVTVAIGQASTGNTFLDASAGHATAEAVYRLYSPVTLEHLYTTDPNEYNTLESYVGTWNGEGEVFSEYSGPATVGGVADEPLYRLYNPSVLQHLWTTDLNEYTVLATEGWNQENIVGYVFPAATGATATSLPTVPGSQALYRLMAPQVHLWTTTPNEYDTLQTEGWTGEGIIGYVV